jgi:hypothetical protein
VQHEWFQRAVAGNEKYLAFFTTRPGRVKTGEVVLENGDVLCRYKDPDGTVTERLCVFPDMVRTHSLSVKLPQGKGQTQIYRSFYPFQVRQSCGVGYDEAE